MNYVLKRVEKNFWLLLVLLCCGWCASCSEDAADDDFGTPVSLQLCISADHRGDAVGRAAVLDPEASENEYMNSLCVLILDESNRIEAKIQPLPAIPWEGKKIEYTEKNVVLQPGRKTIYAFANWETVTAEPQTNSALLDVINLPVGDIVDPVRQIDNIILEDPASRVDLAQGRYIPMSAKWTDVVNRNTGSITIGLDRVVSKVRVEVQPKQINPSSASPIKVDSLKLSGFANRVSLIANGNKATVQVNYARFVEWGPFEVTDKVVTREGYVNETPENRPFEISMKTTQMIGNTQDVGVAYYAETKAKSINRNSILPISLSFSDYLPTFSIIARRAPIGAEPKEYKLPYTQNGSEFAVKMMDVTSDFTITVTGITADQVGKQPKITASKWSIVSNPNSGLKDDSSQNTPQVFKGYFTAQVAKYQLKLDLEWEDAGAIGYKRTYYFNITVVDEYLGDYQKTLNVRSAVFYYPEISILQPEYINMNRIE